MAEERAEVKEVKATWRVRVRKWCDEHPRTGWWIVFWLGLNYILDLWQSWPLSL